MSVSDCLVSGTYNVSHMETERNSTDPDTFTVVAWNILLDKARARDGIITPQSSRIDSQVSTMRQMELSLDVVAIMEAERTETAHNGERMARQLGYGAGYWCQHNRRREYIGMFGSRVERMDAVDMGYNKAAVVTMVGSVAVVGIHLKREQWGNRRAEQMSRLMDSIGDYEQAVVMGDLNAIPPEKAPRILRSYGFQSAYRLVGKKQPPTWPTAGYRDIMLDPWQQRLLRRGIIYDDIYVKNLDVVDAGTFVGDSDHAGVWATVSS